METILKFIQQLITWYLTSREHVVEPVPVTMPEEELPEELRPLRRKTQPPPPPGEKKVHRQKYCWCISNGHGSEQPGKRSPSWHPEAGAPEIQFFEWRFNLDIANRIIEQLKEKGVQYIQLVPQPVGKGSYLKQRIAIANEHQSDLPKLYLSIHANAAPAASANDWCAPNIQGVETWYAEGSRKGRELALVFQRHLVKHTGMKDRKLKNTKQRALTELLTTNMPSVLTESGFYNNFNEVQKLMDDGFRQKIADAHVAAILEIEQYKP